MVSFHGKVGLPTEVKSWIEMWSCLIANRSAALIVLANKPRFTIFSLFALKFLPGEKTFSPSSPKAVSPSSFLLGIPGFA
jgi:hypothetical protein